MSEQQVPTGSIINLSKDYPLHQLGWKAFQDLCVGIAEECLRRPVQTFLPSQDAGRDGAFVGRWEGDDPAAGESTIQCKFTSLPNNNLSLSMLVDEIEKVRRLASKALVADYVIITNHPITGESELAIKEAFQAAGAGCCRVFGYSWIVRQIRTSPRLRMMAPRLYGLGDLNDVLDGRAYAQAQMVLSAMGNDLERLVVTEAHRRSVRAISAHNFVLLLGSPAAGKSTIGASIAVGAADIWKSWTIRATSAEDIKRHLSGAGSQFFWIDDAFGSTQYQRESSEAWNQVFPLMQAAMRNGTRFLMTSRDYIWRSAKSDLKMTLMPVLNKSHVVIDVHELSLSEKAQILYNHLKMGDQPKHFKGAVKRSLPSLAERKDFLPETARRLGSTFFASGVQPVPAALAEFFGKPQSFLLETIRGLSVDSRAAIAVLFLKGGVVRSPVPGDGLRAAAEAFGVSDSQIRQQLEAMNGSLLLLASDEEGPYWTYKHPTVSDAFARYVAESPELIDVYLTGAKAESILREVVCAGVTIEGASVSIPKSRYWKLLERIKDASSYGLKTFATNRSSADFTNMLLEARPNILSGTESLMSPIKRDYDALFLLALHDQGLLTEERRAAFIKRVSQAAIDDADTSAFEDQRIIKLFTTEELISLKSSLLECLEGNIETYIENTRDAWDPEYSPHDHFDDIEASIRVLAESVLDAGRVEAVVRATKAEIRYSIQWMEEQHSPSSSTAAPVSTSTPANAGLVDVFRDVDD